MTTRHPTASPGAASVASGLGGNQRVDTATFIRTAGTSTNEVVTRTNTVAQQPSKRIQSNAGVQRADYSTPGVVQSEVLHRSLASTTTASPCATPSPCAGQSPSTTPSRSAALPNRRSHGPNLAGQSDQDCGKLPLEYGEGRVRPSQTLRQQQPQTYSFYNSDNEVDSIDENSENSEEEAEECETEAQKRQERRRAKAAREREGKRRRKEGLPRNYLLVDEYTKKPYGVGVNEWRKEIMLLSRKLDPAIGQINRQPDDFVREIAEWIQQTWEYSTPIKFEVVKEVIARGVILRRADLWKKIRNGERKPQDVSDRTWRSLRRELENPATIRKSQNCSKANASRVNFGRTGPSGEVGVREKLRKWLRRSLDPEEVRREMARDKGYGGRSKRLKNQDFVMHRSVSVSPLSFEAARLTNDADNEYDDDSEEAPVPFVEPILNNSEKGKETQTATPTIVVEELQMISEEQLVQNPFVMKLMARLAALEGRQRNVEVEVSAVTTQTSQIEVNEARMHPRRGTVHTTAVENQATDGLAEAGPTEAMQELLDSEGHDEQLPPIDDRDQSN